MGEADRVARRHAEARLEAAARLERGHGNGRHLRPHQGRTRFHMTRVPLALVAALAAACATRRGGGAAPAPVLPATPPPVATTDQPAPAAPRRSDAVRYGPSALRYRVHRQLHVQQGQAERLQATDLGARIYLAARSEEHTSELQSHSDLVCRLLLEKKKTGCRAGPATT